MACRIEYTKSTIGALKPKEIKPTMVVNLKPEQFMTEEEFEHPENVPPERAKQFLSKEEIDSWTQLSKIHECDVVVKDPNGEIVYQDKFTDTDYTITRNTLLKYAGLTSKDLESPDDGKVYVIEKPI